MVAQPGGRASPWRDIEVAVGPAGPNRAAGLAPRGHTLSPASGANLNLAYNASSAVGHFLVQNSLRAKGWRVSFPTPTHDRPWPLLVHGVAEVDEQMVDVFVRAKDPGARPDAAGSWASPNWPGV